MGAISTLFAVACAAASQTSSAAPQTNVSYGAVMRAQYAAHSAPIAQRAEEAKRVYDAYLNSIGEKTKSQSENPSGSAGDTSH
jgi:hypothetical protein